MMETTKESIIKIEPIYKNEVVPIVFAANDSYCPIVSVMIQSIIDNSAKENYYDIIILNRDISVLNMERLKSMAEGLDNFSIRFLNVASIIDKYNLYVGGKSDFTVDSYLRMLIPDVLSGKYHKAIYLDGDMIALSDVAELMKVDVTGYLLAACRDISGLGAYYNEKSDRKHYRDNVLHILKPDDYFISGLLILNLDEFRANYTSECLLKLSASREWKQHDQDVLNVICNGGRAKIIHVQWNLLKKYNEHLIPPVCYRELMEAYENPKIVHFGGGDKPWKRLDAIYFDEFWRIAARSPYYIELVKIGLQELDNQKAENRKIRRNLQKSNKELSETRKKLVHNQKELKNVITGLSFKIGRIITWLPRKLLGRK